MRKTAHKPNPHRAKPHSKHRKPPPNSPYHRKRELNSVAIPYSHATATSRSIHNSFYGGIDVGQNPHFHTRLTCILSHKGPPCDTSPRYHAGLVGCSMYPKRLLGCNKKGNMLATDCCCSFPSVTLKATVQSGDQAAGSFVIVVVDVVAVLNGCLSASLEPLSATICRGWHS